jgi:hypothetical protein
LHNVHCGFVLARQPHGVTQQTRLPTVDKSDERLAIAVLAPHHQQFVVDVLGGPHSFLRHYSRADPAEVQEKWRMPANSFLGG